MDKIVELLKEINFLLLYSLFVFLVLNINMCTLHHSSFIYTLILLAVWECSHFSNNWPIVMSS
jgi:hypothetical protein